MTGPNYSDDEIHRLFREVLGEEKPAPTPTVPKPRSMSRVDVLIKIADAAERLVLDAGQTSLT